MKSRGLCLLTAAILFLLALPFAPAYACSFCDDDPDPDTLDLVGYTAPT